MERIPASYTYVISTLSDGTAICRKSSWDEHGEPVDPEHIFKHISGRKPVIEVLEDIRIDLGIEWPLIIDEWEAIEEGIEINDRIKRLNQTDLK